MFRVLLKFLPTLIYWGIFGYVVLQIPYPETLTQASLFQLISFFLPLSLAISFTFNLLLKNIFVSSSLSLGIIFILILKALNSFNIVTGILTIASIALLISYFRKSKRNKLTIDSKIPKLTHLRKNK